MFRPGETSISTNPKNCNLSYAITHNLHFVHVMMKFFLIIQALFLYTYIYMSVLKLLQYNIL